MADWLTLSPTSGTGDGTVTVTAAEHTGRVQRTSTITGTTSSNITASVAVTQAAKAEFITLDSVTISSGYLVTITGTSNSGSLEVSATGAANSESYSDFAGYSLKVNGTADTSWDPATASYSVSGDPGASAEYTFVITYTISEQMLASLSAGTQTGTIAVSAEGDYSSNTVTLTYSVDSAISVSPATLEFTADGGSGTITVESNDGWTVASN